MNNNIRYLIEGITKDILLYLMKDYGWDLSKSITKFVNSTTHKKLSDKDSGLYLDSSAYVYELFKTEMQYGKLS